MDKVKFILVSIIVLALVGLGGYWAVATMQSGSEHVSTQKIKTLENENEDLIKQVDKLEKELAVLEENAIKEQDAKPEEASKMEVEKPKVSVKRSAPVTTSKNQGLINELQKLINDNIFLKLKSNGTRVGTVQKFLNIYNKTSNKVDNDYGGSTKTAVSAFQKDQGLTADGEAGPGTFKKMIDWLKKQG